MRVVARNSVHIARQRSSPMVSISASCAWRHFGSASSTSLRPLFVTETIRIRLSAPGRLSISPSRSKGASARVMLVRSMTMYRPSVEIDSSFSVRITRSSENCVMLSPSSRRKSSYMRETARVALRKSKHAHCAINSLRVFVFIRHRRFFRPRLRQVSSQESDYTRSAHVLCRIIGAYTLMCQAMQKRIERRSGGFAMTSQRSVVFAEPVRTAIGTFGGSLKDVPAPSLGAVAIGAAVARAGIRAEDAETVVMGNVVQAGTKMNPARQAAVHAGLPVTVPALTVNRVCGSGAQAIVSAAQEIALDNININVAVAGGMENMDQAPYLIARGRWGYRMGDGALYDSVLRDGLNDAVEK